MKRPLLGIAFLGLGYIGLCTATSFALKGFKIVGVDVEQEKFARSPLAGLRFTNQASTYY